MKLWSEAFSDGAPIPPQHTCEGENGSPDLRIDDVPAGTQSLVLVAEDPDYARGVWVHWLRYGIPPEVEHVAGDTPPDGELPDGSRQGRNDFNELGYGGPCPPRGTEHRYVFRLFALDQPLALGPGVDRETLLGAMRGHVLAEARLTGTCRIH